MSGIDLEQFANFVKEFKEFIAEEHRVLQRLEEHEKGCQKKYDELINTIKEVETNLAETFHERISNNKDKLHEMYKKIVELNANYKSVSAQLAESKEKELANRRMVWGSLTTAGVTLFAGVIWAVFISVS